MNEQLKKEILKDAVFMYEELKPLKEGGRFMAMLKDRIQHIILNEVTKVVGKDYDGVIFTNEQRERALGMMDGINYVVNQIELKTIDTELLQKKK